MGEFNAVPSLKGPIIATILIPLLSFGMYQAAVDVAAGGVREFHGRNAALKSLVYSAGGTLGTTGSIIVGGVASLAAILWLAVTIQKRRQLKAVPEQA